MNNMTCDVTFDMWHDIYHVTWHVTWPWLDMWREIWLDIWHTTWHVICDVTWHITFDIWHNMQHVMWHLKCDMTCDLWHDMWSVTCHVTCNIWHNVTFDMTYDSVSTGGHWGKIVFLEFELFTCRYLNFRLCWSLNCFYFFQLQNNELSRDLQSWTNLPVLTFSLKYGQNLSSKYKIKTCSWEAIFMKLFFVYEYLIKLLWKKFCENHFSGTYCNFIFRWIFLPFQV